MLISNNCASFLAVKLKFGKTSNSLKILDINEFISDKFFHPISHFQIIFISIPVKVLKSNVIEFYIFLTTSSIDLYLLNFTRIYPRKLSWFYTYNLYDVIIMTPDFTYFRNKGVILICIYSSEEEIY